MNTRGSESCKKGTCQVCDFTRTTYYFKGGHEVKHFKFQQDHLGEM